MEKLFPDSAACVILIHTGGDIFVMLYLQMLPSPSEKDKFEQIYTLYRGLMFYIARRILPGEADLRRTRSTRHLCP